MDWTRTKLRIHISILRADLEKTRHAPNIRGDVKLALAAGEIHYSKKNGAVGGGAQRKRCEYQ